MKGKARFADRVIIGECADRQIEIVLVLPDESCVVANLSPSAAVKIAECIINTALEGVPAKRLI